MSAAMDAFFGSAGDTGRHMLSVDWAATALGPVEGWPQSLRTTLSIVLTSRHPLLIWWGPDLLMLYNDALAPSFGDKHPRAIGRPGEEMFAEMWDRIGPMLHSVLSTGQSTWRRDEPLPMHRGGMLEDTYWTYSYSPIHEIDGRVAGVFTATSETTARVLRERRLRALQALSVGTTGSASVEDLAVSAMKALGEHPSDLARASVYLPAESSDTFFLAAASSAPDPVHGAGYDAVADVVARVGRSGRGTRVAPPDAADGTWITVLPVIAAAATSPAAVLLCENAAGIRADPDYQEFVQAVADRLAVGLTGVHAVTAERARARSLDELHAAQQEVAEREHRIADELQRSLLPAHLGSPPGLEVAAHYRAGVAGTRVGGDWYDVIELGGQRSGLVVGDVMGRGVRSAALMGVVRAAIRAYARLDLSPVRLLTLLDGLVRDMSDEQIVTCVYGVFDASDGSLHYANAGHPPPLLVDPSGSVASLRGGVCPPLGTGCTGEAGGTATLQPGALVAMYTDGLIERPGQDLADGIGRLAQLLAPPTGGIGPLASAPARVVATLRPGDADENDDIALLLIRRTGVPQ